MSEHVSAPIRAAEARARSGLSLHRRFLVDVRCEREAVLITIRLPQFGGGTGCPAVGLIVPPRNGRCGDLSRSVVLGSAVRCEPYAQRERRKRRPARSAQARVDASRLVQCTTPAVSAVVRS